MSKFFQKLQITPNEARILATNLVKSAAESEDSQSSMCASCHETGFSIIVNPFLRRYPSTEDEDIAATD